MTMTKAELLEKMRGEIAEARRIADHAAGRAYSPSEAAAIKSHLEAAEQLKRRAGDTEIRAAIDNFFTDGGTTTAAKADKPAWSTKNRRGSEWAKTTVEVVDRVNRVSGTKALVSGSIDVASPIFADVTKIADYPLTLLDLLVDRVAISTHEFSFVRQTVRTDNAAPVADGELKPTSIYTVADVSDHVRTVAHLSQPVPERLFSDHADLLDFLSSEMEAGLRRAVEEQVVSGDGVDPNMTGILETSGILTQAWSTDLLTTMRKASTALEVSGEVPTAWALNPADVEALDLLDDANARHYFSGPQQQLSNGNPVWSLPIVKSLAVPAGTAILGDWNYIRLVVREDARLDVDRSGENFTKNLVTVRVEGRYGVAVRRPSAFCQVDLTSA